MRVSAVAPTFVIFAMIFASGCDQPPDASTVWTPADHDKQEQSRGQQAAQPLSSAARGAQLVEAAWMQSCARCHGPRGVGDGPEGPMVKAPDLTDAEWQAKVKDDEMAEIIRKGKALMPPSNLPEPLIQGLVARIRALRAAKP